MVYAQVPASAGRSPRPSKLASSWLWAHRPAHEELVTMTDSKVGAASHLKKRALNNW